MKHFEEILDTVLNWELLDMTLSHRKNSGDIQKIKVRPVIIKDKLVFQAAQYTKTQVFHKNIEEDEMREWLSERIRNDFKQTQIKAGDKEYTLLSGKKGNVTVRERHGAGGGKATAVPGTACGLPDKSNFSHNRKKTYILPEGTPVPFLVDLGVMTTEGRIVRSKYDKYRQINRFLEFIQDVLPELPKGRELTMIDFGCGKSYLTFAMYYYLNILMGYSVKMIGLDLKADVIRHCNELRDKYGYEKLEFIHGDIADFEGADAVDMVIIQNMICKKQRRHEGHQIKTGDKQYLFLIFHFLFLPLSSSPEITNGTMSDHHEAPRHSSRKPPALFSGFL